MHSFFRFHDRYDTVKQKTHRGGHMQCNLNIHSLKKVLPGAASAASTTSSRSTPSHALVFDLSISLGELEKRRENCIWKSHLCWHRAIAAGNLHLEIETPEFSPVQGATLLRSNDYWTYSIRARVTLLIL